jgi:hypothetical protein
MQSLRATSVQAQRVGQSRHRIEIRETSDASFEVGDRPRAQARPLRELLLGQPSPQPVPPQQVPELGLIIKSHLRFREAFAMSHLSGR